MTLIEYFEHKNFIPGIWKCRRILEQIEEKEDIIEGIMSETEDVEEDNDYYDECQMDLEYLYGELNELLQGLKHEKLDIRHELELLDEWIESQQLTKLQAEERIKAIFEKREQLLSSFDEEDFLNDGVDDEDEEQNERFNEVSKIVDDLYCEAMLIRIDGVACIDINNALCETDNYSNTYFPEVKYDFTTDYLNGLLEAIKK